MKKRRIYDISPLISPELAVWPGDVSFSSHQALSIAKGNNIDLSSITGTVHLGAHADAPSHYSEKGIGIESVPLEPYIGPCQVIHVGTVGLIKPEHFAHLLNKDSSRILFRTDSYLNPNHFNEDFTAFAPQSLDLLKNHDVVLVGIDTPSMDVFHSKDLPSHQKLIEHGLYNLEGLVLKNIQPGLYELIALPLPMQGLDASPVRAILLDLI